VPVKQAFSSEVRLLTADDFTQVFQNGCCKAGDNAFLLLARHNQLEQPRLGLVIAKKQLKRAVDRNRVKRIARESFRHQLQALAGVDVVVLCRSGAFGLDKAEIRHHMNRLFDKIVRLNNP
jgi:ribonuclease P protein component